MKKILHIITSLDPPAGAENMLYKCVAYRQEPSLEQVVISLTEEGDFGRKVSDSGVDVYYLGANKNLVLSIYKFFRVVRNEKPDLVQGWMYHANLFAILAKFFRPRSQVLFNIRQSLTGNKEKKLTKFVIKLNAFLSHFVTKVINNSGTSQLQHQSIGFSKKNKYYIPNGFDIKKFIPNDSIYFSFRNKRKIASNTKLFGTLARYHPMKGHKKLLNIFRDIKNASRHDIMLVLGGRNINIENKELMNLIDDFGLTRDCILLDQVETNMILPALDLYVSPSLNEGFPNIIGEAMSCGVPCVATDVGDCRDIIDGYGSVVAVDNHEGLVSACLDLIDANPIKPEEIRQHMIDNYSINEIVNEYENLYLNLLSGKT